MKKKLNGVNYLMIKILNITPSQKLKNITAYKLAKIIYPDLNQKKFKKISNFIIKNIEIKK